MTTTIPKNAKFLEAQSKVAVRLTEKYSNERKIEYDKVCEPIIWAKSLADIKVLIKMFMLDDVFKIDYLSDVTAYDNQDGEDGDKRFVMVYNLYSLEKHIRVRVKALVAENEQVPSITDLWPGANWFEREVFDMFGISFSGHPNLRRILMDERFTGHPLRKEYPIKQREPFKDNIRIHLGGNPLSVDTSVNEGEK